MKKWNMRKSDERPHYATKGKDDKYILKCKSDRASAIWEQSMIELSGHMKTKHVNDNVTAAIMEHRKAWKKGREL